MNGRKLMASATVLGVVVAGAAHAPAGALVEDPGPQGVVPKAGKWKGSARTSEGRIFPLTFRVTKVGRVVEVRDLVTKGISTCAQDDGSLSRDVVALGMPRERVRTRGPSRGVWTYDRNDKSVHGKFRTAGRMTGTFSAPPPDASCNGTTVFLRARLAVPARR